MLQKMKPLYILLILIAVMSNAQGQNNIKKITISGHVVDSANTPVEGAAILVDNTDSGKKTNSRGFYKIKVSPKASSLSVVTYFDGMTTEINNNTTIDFSLLKTQGPKIKYESGISSANPNRIEGNVTKNAQYSNIYQMLSSTVPGVSVNGKTITIRGQTTFFNNPSPIFDVDGVITNSIDHIFPADVVSIEVLKTSSAAIYGALGSYGVIKIKTVNR
jgi:hypothetical protein